MLNLNIKDRKVEKYVKILEAKIFFLKKFNLIFAHDTKAVLRKINSLLTILKGQSQTELVFQNKMQIIDFLSQNISLINDIFDDMLGLEYQNTQNEIPLIKEAIEHVKKIFQEEIMKSNITFYVSDFPSLKVRKYDIYRIFQNLISNSIQHSKSQSLRICIESEKLNTGWLIRYSDNGTGKKPEDQTIEDIISSDYHLGERIIQHIVSQYGGNTKNYTNIKGYKFEIFFPNDI